MHSREGEAKLLTCLAVAKYGREVEGRIGRKVVILVHKQFTADPTDRVLVETGT